MMDVHRQNYMCVTLVVIFCRYQWNRLTLITSYVKSLKSYVSSISFLMQLTTVCNYLVLCQRYQPVVCFPDQEMKLNPMC